MLPYRNVTFALISHINVWSNFVKLRQNCYLSLGINLILHLFVHKILLAYKHSNNSFKAHSVIAFISSIRKLINKIGCKLASITSEFCVGSRLYISLLKGNALSHKKWLYNFNVGKLHWSIRRIVSTYWPMKLLCFNSKLLRGTVVRQSFVVAVSGLTA